MSEITELERRIASGLAAIAAVVPDEPPTSWVQARARHSHPTVAPDGDRPTGTVLTLLRPADLVDPDVPPATARHEADRRGAGRLLRRRQGPDRGRRRLVVAAAAVVATAVSVTAIVVPLAGGPAGASAFSEAAAAVAGRPYPEPGPGQVLYTEDEVGLQVTQVGAGGITAHATVVATVRQWLSPDGSGQAQILFGSPQFPSAADQQRWQYNIVVLPPGMIHFGPGQVPIEFGAQLGTYQVGALPTDPAALLQSLEAGNGPVANLPVEVDGAPGAFERAGLLLAAPQLGGSAALESAVYGVLNDLPGVEALGTVRDHAGVSGQGFTMAGAGMTLIIDPATGRLLELQRSPTVAFPDKSPAGSSIGALETTQTLWTEPVQDQVMSATSAPIPPASP